MWGALYKPRMGKLGRDHCHPVQPLCPCRVPQNVLLRVVSRQLLSISRGDLHSLSGSPVPGSATLNKKFFLIFRWNFLSTSSAHSSCPMSQLLPALSPPCRQWQTWLKSPLSCLFLGLNRPSSLRVSSSLRLSSPPLTFVALFQTCSRSSTVILKGRSDYNDSIPCHIMEEVKALIYILRGKVPRAWQLWECVLPVELGCTQLFFREVSAPLEMREVREITLGGNVTFCACLLQI